MSIGKYILSFIIGIFFITSIVAQQVWPVQVTGSLVPPHSLNLGVYGAERTQDLTFSAMLKDPVQASLQVRLSLSIEQNGTIIYQTDPNYVGMPITLNQFQNMVLDGNVLRSYLNSQALTGVNGTGMGSIEIPEGFNQICLQIYGLDRNVPISNKFCMSGNFRLNQPPQIVKPACGEKIIKPETQNILFNWQPMHLGSPNSPGAVEYEFELVQLPEGTFNANDVFDSALKIYKTKSFSSSLLYTQAEPNLVPNKVYAWRVRATSVMNPTSRLFQNDGLSQICTFMLYEGDKPLDDINPTDNPAPRGCSVFSTEYGPIDRSEPVSGSIIEGDIVKLGYFNLKIQSVSGGASGYDGKGLVEFPMLRSKIPVTFSGIKINKGNRVFESDRITTDLSTSISLSDAQLKVDQIANAITKEYMTTKLIPEVKKSANFVDNFNVTEYKINKLPIALGSATDKNPIYVIGIQFTPANAFLNLASMDTNDSGYAIYAATALQATPYGLQNGAHLVPINTSGAVSNSKSVISTLELTVSNDGKSRMNCDCKGFKDLDLKETLQISPDILVRADNGSPVVLELKDKKSDKATYFGEAGKMPDFEIKGLAGFKFNADKSFVDLSETNTIENARKYVSAEEGIENQAWKGVLINDATVVLPDAYNFHEGKKLIIDKGEILINKDEISYGNFTKENLISLENGKVENWKYSIDKYSLSIEKGQVVGPSISGKLKLPVADNLLDYSGDLLQSGNSNARMNIAMLKGDINVGMWSANMSLSSESNIGLEIKNLGNEKMMYPSAKLSGDLNINVTNAVLEDKIKGNVAQTLSDIKQALGLQTDDLSFSISKLNINNWNLSPYDVPENKYTANSVDVEKARFDIGGKSFDVTLGEVLKRTTDNKERVGMSVVIKEGNNKINFILWGAEYNGAFAFDEIEVHIIDIRCNCAMEPIGIGKVELQKLYDKLIEEAYTINYQKSPNSSGKQSYEDESNIEFQLFHAKMKSELEMNTTEGGWIVQEGKVLIPFLDIKIRVTEEGNKLVGYNSGLQSFDINNKIGEDLPIIVNPDLFTKLGFHTTYNIPENSRFLITDLTIPDKNKPVGNLTFVIISYVKKPGSTEEIFSDLFNKTMLFESKSVKITNATNTAINLANLELWLKRDLKSVNYDESIDEYEFKEKVKMEGRDRVSKVRMDCEKGFQNFEMVGYYKPKNLVPVGDDKLKMLFTVNTALDGNVHDLSEFIGVISDENDKGEKWKFNVSNQPQLIFTAGKSYKIYLDYSSKIKIPGINVSKNFIQRNNEAFQGLVFIKFEGELPMFKPDNINPLTLALTDGIYDKGDVGIRPDFSIIHTSTKVIPEVKGANFTGWRYSVDTISFKILSGRMLKNISYNGKMLIPLFKDKPIDFEKRKFDRGWANFSGTVISNDGRISSNISFDSLQNQLFQSVLVPGMAMKLNASSKVEVKYNEQTQKWIPEGTFSGMCDFYLNDNVALSMNMISPPGLEIEADPISFENMRISAEQITSAIKFNLEGDQISYIDLGEWGDVDAKDLAKIDEVEDFRERLKEVSREKKPAGVSKAMPATQGSKGGSKAMFLGFDLVTTYLGPKQRDGELVMGLKLAIGLMGATKEKTDKGTETKAQFIRTEGVLGLVYKPSGNSQDTWKFNSVTLECLSVEGQLGPVGFAGGLNILRDDGEYGSGLKGYLSGEIEKLGGMTMVGQFGKKKEGEKDFYYGFLDLEVFSEQGIPLFYDPITNIPKIDFFGAGGGIHINMATKKAIDTLQMPSTTDMAKKDQQRKDTEQRKASKNFCKDLGGDLLQPGIGLNQSYTPKQGTFGGKVFVIFGPYSPVKPPYTLVADAGIRIEMDWNNETNELSLGEMNISTRGYLMPASIRERRENNAGDIYAGITLDWRKKILDGEISFRSKFDIPVIGKTLFSMPVKYEDTDFSTRKNYNTGRLRFGFSPSDPYAELKLGGPGTGELKPISGTFLTRPFPLTYTTVEAYAQIGANVDAPRKLEDMIPELKDILSEVNKKEREETLKKERTDNLEFGTDQAKGIAFGLVMQQDVNANFLLLHGELKVKLGFDVNLREYKDVLCSNSTNQGQIGLKGWYAKGSAFAYASGKIDMGFRLFGVDLTTNIFHANAYLTMQVEGPNPTYFRGMIGGQYNVLDGMYSGEFQYKVVIGEQCEYTKPPDPLADISIFKNASITDGQKNVDRYSDITLNTNVPLRKDYTLTQKDTKGEASYAVNFLADYKDISVLKNGSRININTKLDASRSNKAINISFDQTLEPLTEYTIEYEFGWKVKEGAENTAKYVNRDKPEKGKIIFTTGERPTSIVAGMIEYSAPGDRQRYWHKGYADTEIKFKIKALEDAAALFPDVCKTCGSIRSTSGEIKYRYKAVLNVLEKNAGEKFVTNFPITGYPSQGVNAEIQTPKSTSIDGKYNITYMEKSSVPVSKVSFPELKNFNLAKGAIYKLYIVRELDIVLPSASDPDYNKIKKIFDENFLILNSYHFATSMYDNLDQKLANLEIKHIKSDMKLRDFSHPSDVYDSERAGVINQLGESKFHSVRDDFYSVKIKDRKNNESFDKYDILRLRRNIRLDYFHDYIPAVRVSQFHQNKGMNDILGGVLNNPSFNLAGKSYLKKVLFDHTKAEEKGMHEFGNTNKISDGTKWHYRLSGATSESFQTLTDNEINSKTIASAPNEPNLSNGIPQLNGKSVNGDILIQDLRSRIVINQLHWLSTISQGTLVSYGDGYNEFISVRGKGEFRDNGRRDFSWITEPPSGLKNVYNNYIASEPGYRLSYHGHSKLSFPKGDWGEMVESKRDKSPNAEMTFIAACVPDRTPGSEIEIENVTELSLEEWYYIKKNGTSRIDAKHNSGYYYNVWGLEQPYFDKNESSAYGIYTPAYGLIYDNGWTYIEDIPGDYSTLWKFSNTGKNISIRNYVNKYRDIKFPAVLKTKGSEISPEFKGDRDQNIDVTFTERNQSFFNSEKVYRIKDSAGRIMKDVKDSERWRIYREGRFYRIVSANGYILFFHRYDPWGPGDYLQAQVENKSFPSKGTSSNSRNHYYTRLWNITDTGGGSYVIQNAFKVNHHLKIHEGSKIEDEGTRVDHFFDDYPEKFTIEEIK